MKWPQTWTSKDRGVSMLWPCLCEVDSRVCLCTDLSRVPHNIQEVWGTNALISPPASQDSDTTVSDSSIWGHVFADAHCFKIERFATITESKKFYDFVQIWLPRLLLAPRLTLCSLPRSISMFGTSGRPYRTLPGCPLLCMCGAHGHPHLEDAGWSLATLQ